MASEPPPQNGIDWPPENPRHRVDVEWAEFGGRWEPAKILVSTLAPDETGPVTGTTLRGLPIGRIVEMLRAEQQWYVEHITANWIPVEPLPDDYKAAWERGEKPRLGVEHYQRVADVYTRAFMASQRPVRVVAETFEVSNSTASQWVSRARHKYGLLPPAKMGKANA